MESQINACNKINHQKNRLNCLKSVISPTKPKDEITPSLTPLDMEQALKICGRLAPIFLKSNNTITKEDEPEKDHEFLIKTNNTKEPTTCRLDKKTKKLISLTIYGREKSQSEINEMDFNASLKDEVTSGQYEKFLKLRKEETTKNLKDPSSAQFRNLYISFDKGETTPTLCGEINAKNSYGGYVGFRRFYSIGSQMNEIENLEPKESMEKIKQSIFDIIHPRYCSNKFVEIP